MSLRSFWKSLAPSGARPAQDHEVERAHDLAEAGRDAEAAAVCASILAIEPNQPRILHLTGVLALRAGNLAEAQAQIRRAIAASPDTALFHFNLGNALTAAGDFAAAASAFTTAVQLNPTHAAARFNLGKTLIELKQHDAAIDCLAALCAMGAMGAMWPDHAAARAELATAHYRKACTTHLVNDYALTVTQCETALALAGLTPPEAHSLTLFLGDSLAACKRYREALALFRRVLAAHPDDLDAMIKVANCLSNIGDMRQAMQAFEQVLRRAPDNLPTVSAVICAMDYLQQVSPDANTARRRELVQRYATPERRRTWNNPPEPGRRLRVGYVSPDLRTHAAMYLFEPVLRLHDQQAFEWFVYDATVDRDRKSAQLRTLVKNWREIDSQKISDLPRMVERDGIDILVDLAGHTSNNRLMSFAWKAAPVQASWLAYPGSTGMPEVDYLISDPHTSPPQFDHHAAETVWRLPATRFCYQPPEGAPEPRLPDRALPVTFACFNNIGKLNAEVFRLWRAILEQAPDARLTIKSFAVDDADGRALLETDLRAAGMPLERIDLYGSTPYLENFSAYNGVHIALDPFPFCGGLTSLDALWMGVPVVTLEQELMAGRQTIAFLRNIDHPELIAATPEDYVRIAVDLARDAQRIAAYRTGLRAVMRASPLLDAATLTRHLEDAYRQMWQRWCASQA